MPWRTRLRDLHWTFPPLAAFLGALGGWSWLWVRRYVLPITGGVLAWAYGIRLLRCLGYAVATSVALSLGYSPERNAPFAIFLVGASYGATPLILSFRWRRSWWPLLTGLALVGLLTLSAQLSWWTHKWTETVVFGLHGFLVAWVIDRSGTEQKT